MDIKRRFALYGVGLLIGGAAAYFAFGDRLLNASWTPKERIKLRIAQTLTKATPSAAAALSATGLTLEELRTSVPQAEVILTETRRSGDSLFYQLRAQPAAKPLLLTVQVFEDHRRDSSATLMRIE
ncbi:MAG: hypothetical protein KA175_13285 [Flavobacteriales bacterium]|nr:hypothetical protein [Flavobacteriales bacterium]MBP6698587.1 hypothetical protein [Flavobacteriales bacterium]